jgi:hypothetical protein
MPEIMDGSLYDTNLIENEAFNNSTVVACVLVAAVMFLPSRCRATTSGILPICWLATIGEYMYRQRDWWEEFIKYAVKIGLGNRIYIPSFMKM